MPSEEDMIREKFFSEEELTRIEALNAITEAVPVLKEISCGFDQVITKLGELAIEVRTANDLKALEIQFQPEGPCSDKIREIMRDRALQYEALHAGDL